MIGTSWVAPRCVTEAFSATCAVHIKDCKGWWSSGYCGSVAEHWRLKPVKLPAFSLSSILPKTSKFSVKQGTLSMIASFSGLPTVQFLIACSMQKQRRRPDPFYHVNDVSVYLGIDRGREGPPIKRMHSAHVLLVLNQEWYVFRFLDVWNSSAWDRNCKVKLHASSFDWGPLPPSVYLGRQPR